MSCENQKTQAACKRAGGSGVIPTGQLPALSEDMARFAAVLARFSSWEDFTRSLAAAVQPEWEAYRAAIRRTKKGGCPHQVFRDAGNAYLEAAARFMGIAPFFRWRLSGRLTASFWGRLENYIRDWAFHSDAAISRSPQRLAQELKGWLPNEFARALIGDANRINQDVASRLSAALQGQAAGDIPLDWAVSSHLLPLIRQARRHPNLAAFRSAFLADISRDHTRLAESRAELQKRKTMRSEQRVFDAAAELEASIWKALGYADKPAGGSLGQLRKTLKHLVCIQSTDPDLPLADAGELWEVVLRKMPDEAAGLLLEAGAAGKPELASEPVFQERVASAAIQNFRPIPYETINGQFPHLLPLWLEAAARLAASGDGDLPMYLLRRHAGEARAAIEILLQAGHDIPLDLLARYPDLLARYGV